MPLPVTVVSQPVTWHEAFVRCDRDGGSLALPGSTVENGELSRLLRMGKVPTAWLGAADMTGEGDWRWAKRPPLSWSTLAYNSWAHGPTQVHAQGCAVLHSSGEWSVALCNSTFAYACEGATSREGESLLGGWLLRVALGLVCACVLLLGVRGLLRFRKSSRSHASAIMLPSSGLDSPHGTAGASPNLVPTR